MPSNSQYKFFHGPMLNQMCEVAGVSPTKQNKEVIKRFFKTLYKIDSLADLSTIGMQWFITKIAIFYATEFGFTLDMPGEENVDDMDLKQMLKLTYHDREAR
jgi:hypothetical protein